MSARTYESGVHYYLMGALVLLIGVFQVTAASRLTFAGVKPNLMLLLVIIWTLLYGSRSGLVWAFIAGVWLDVFSNGPMGATSLAFMTACLFTGIGHQSLSRFNMLVPLVASALGTFIFAVVYLFVLDTLALTSTTLAWMLPDYRLPFQATMQNIVAPLVLYNTTLMLIAIPFLNRVPASGAIPRLDEVA